MFRKQIQKEKMKAKEREHLDSNHPYANPCKASHLDCAKELFMFMFRIITSEGGREAI